MQRESPARWISTCSSVGSELMVCRAVVHGFESHQVHSSVAQWERTG